MADVNNITGDLPQNVTTSLSDPFGSIITNTFTKVGNLINNIDKKINLLIKDVAESTDSKGRVTVQGSSIVITISREDSQQAEELKKRVDNKVSSIQKTITTLETVLKTAKTIKTSIQILQQALDLQEVLLNTNPATAVIFTVLKQGVKLIFLKDMIKEYSKILDNQIASNTVILEKLSDKFKNINVSIKISDEKNKGNYVTPDTAENLLSQDKLNEYGDDIQNITDEYTSPKNKTYILKVEKYADKKLIGRAYEKDSGMIEEQTAPSFFATPDQLLEELKSILYEK